MSYIRKLRSGAVPFPFSVSQTLHGCWQPPNTFGVQKIKRQLPNVLVLILTIVIIGMSISLLQELLYYGDRGQQFYYLISIVGLLLFLILIRQLISIRQISQQDKKKSTINSEFDLMVNLLYRNVQETGGKRQELFVETNEFIREVNQFIHADRYQLYLTSLLEASQDIAKIESSQKKRGLRRRKRYRRRNTQSPIVATALLARQNYLVELGISELTNKKLLVNAGAEEFQQLMTQMSQSYVTDYQEVASLFDCLLISLKYLNHKLVDNELSLTEYDHYISILRNLLSREDLAIVLIYALVIPEGCALGIELMGSSFFGNQAELLSQKYVDCPELFLDALNTFTDHKTARKRKSDQRIIRYYYAAILKEISHHKLNKKELITNILNQNVSHINADLNVNYLQLMEVAQQTN